MVDLTPRMRRIWLGGDALGDFPDEEPGEILTLIWPHEPGATPVPPADGWRYAPGTPDQHWRNYTIRELTRDGEPRVAIDFVLHGDHGAASAWAIRAQPGDVIGFAGPRIHFYADPDADWTLLCGDETALPSIAASLERLPAGHRVLAYVEVADAGERLALSTDCELELTWLTRDGEPAGRSRRLHRRVAAAAFPPGRPKVWVAGESLAVRELREHLRDVRGLEIGPMQAIGYWKHRLTPADVD